MYSDRVTIFLLSFFRFGGFVESIAAADTQIPLIAMLKYITLHTVLTQSLIALE
jgi:hypothetical protein